MEKLLLKEDEVCQQLSLGRSTIRRLMAEGALVPIHIGRAIRFRAGDVELYARELGTKSQGAVNDGSDN